MGSRHPAIRRTDLDGCNRRIPRPASNARTHVIDLRAATMSTVELLLVLYFLLVAVALLALYLVERRWRKGP
jgi:hypothetical protein